MKWLIVTGAALAALALTQQAAAATCARGVYRAGCVGPNGAAVVHRPVGAPVHAAVVARPAAAGTVRCANGVYRAGCVGPNGAAVVRKRY